MDWLQKHPRALLGRRVNVPGLPHVCASDVDATNIFVPGLPQSRRPAFTPCGMQRGGGLRAHPPPLSMFAAAFTCGLRGRNWKKKISEIGRHFSEIGRDRRLSQPQGSWAHGTVHAALCTRRTVPMVHFLEPRVHAKPNARRSTRIRGRIRAQRVVKRSRSRRAALLKTLKNAQNS